MDPEEIIQRIMKDVDSFRNVLDTFGKRNYGIPPTQVSHLYLEAIIERTGKAAPALHMFVSFN